jgi:hypothetical protein
VDVDVLERRQLDLFLDGRDAFLIHDVVRHLVARDPEGAASGLGRLQEEHPAHPDLPVLAVLTETLRAGPPLPATHVGVSAWADAMERTIVPAARRFLGKDAAVFLRPLWERAASMMAGRSFDGAHPRAHRGWLCQQYEDWCAVRAAVEAEPDCPVTSELRYWLGLARHHLGEPEGAIRLWLPLCWTDPMFFARHAAALPSATVREGWDAFERAPAVDDPRSGATDAAGWFPAWLLARHWGLARLFSAEEVPDAGLPARAFRCLLSLVRLEPEGLTDELVAHRRALQQLSPEFFRRYMEIVSYRRSGR